MITRAQMPRQLRDKGGIASVTPRENYGLGSKIKDRFRKLIPNELADVAVKAAPFVAPFNPGIAGLMRGIGRFDQRGSISDALKQGAATFGFGKAAGFLGGAQSDPGILGRQRFSMENFRQGPVGRLFKGDIPGGDTNTPKFTGKEKTGPLKKAAEKVFENVPFSDKLSTKVKEKLLVGGLTSGASALYSYFTGEFEPQEPGESLEEYMARRRESVKSQMRQVMDSYYTPLRNPQYAAMSAEEKDKFIDSIVGQGMATGGRVGYQTGGITMANTLAENIRRNIANQAAVAKQFEQARKNIPQRTAVQEYAMGEDSILGPLSKKAASTIMEGQDKSQAALDVLNLQRPLSLKDIDQTGMPRAITQDDIDTFNFTPPKTDTGIMTQSPTTDTAQISGAMDSLINVNKQPIQYSNIPELTRLMDDVNQKANDTVIRSLAEADEYLKMQAGPPKKIIPEEGTIGPINLDEFEPRPQEEFVAPIDELIKPIMPTLPVEPRTDQDLIEGFAKFKEQNPEVMQGVGTMAIVEGTLPDGTPIRFSGGLESSAFNKYLESLGLSRADIVKPRENIESLLKSAKLTKLDDPMMTGFDYSKEINWSPGQPAPEGYRVVNMMGDEFLERKFPSKEEVAGLPRVFSEGGRVRFSEGANIKIKLKQIGYEDTLLDKMSLKELRDLLDSEKGTFTDQGTYREPAKKGGMPTGIMKTNKAGVMERDYRDKGGFVPVGIKEKADDVPAMLSKNEFVFTADAVRGAGNGSIEKGAQRMYDTMKNLEKRVT